MAISNYTTKEVELLNRACSGTRILKKTLFFFFSNSAILSYEKRFLYLRVIWLNSFPFSPSCPKSSQHFPSVSNWPVVRGVVYPASNYRLGHVIVFAVLVPLVFLFAQLGQSIFLTEGFCRLSIPFTCLSSSSTVEILRHTRRLGHVRVSFA